MSCPGLPGTLSARSGLSSLSVPADVLRVSAVSQVQGSARAAQFVGLISPGLAFCPKFMGISQGWAPSCSHASGKVGKNTTFKNLSEKLFRRGDKYEGHASARFI